MSLRVSRLGPGDYLTLVGSVALVVVLFAMKWYEVPGRFRDSMLELGGQLSANGWDTFTWIGPLCVLVAVWGLAAVWLQLSRDSPALPTVAVVLLAPLAFVLVVALLIRVFIAVPGFQLPGGRGATLEHCDGSYVGFACALCVFAGVWLSLRRDGVDPRDSPAVIETLPLS